MRILFLSGWFPYPPSNGSKIRIFNILKQLSRHHEISLVTFQNKSDFVTAETVSALHDYCSSVRVLPSRVFHSTSSQAVLGLLSRQPRYLAATYSDDMSAVVADEFRKQRSELVVASELGMMPYALTLRGVPALLEDLELSMYMTGDRGSSLSPRWLRAQLTWLKVSAYLRRALPRFAACTVVSEREKGNLQAAAPRYPRIEVIPNAVDLSSYDRDYGPAFPNTMVFSGALTYYANYDALRYLLKDIYPLITRAVPSCALRVTGDITGVDLASLPVSEPVEYMGHAPDVRPVVARSSLSVVPLRLGGGTRLKILEAMALGTPVVSTSKGAEGLDVTDGENILIADQPDEFAAKVVRALGSPELRQRLAEGGRRLVEARYDWGVLGDELHRVVERAAA